MSRASLFNRADLFHENISLASRENLIQVKDRFSRNLFQMLFSTLFKANV